MPTTISGTSGVDKVKDINAVPFLPFTKEYVSAEQVITSGGLLTIAHDLGASPKLWVADFTIRYGNNGATPLFGLNKGTGAITNLTAANWRLILRAWA